MVFGKLLFTIRYKDVTFYMEGVTGIRVNLELS